MNDDDGDPLTERRWRFALYGLAVIGSIDLVQLIALVVFLIMDRT